MVPYEDVVKLLHSNGNKSTTFKNLLKMYKKYQRWGAQPTNQGLLSRDFKGNDITNGRAFTAYEAFIKKYNEENPMDQIYLLAVLTARYGDEVAAHVIVAATRFQSNKKFAKEVQGIQMKLWLENKISPRDVLKWIVPDQTHVLQTKALKWLRYVADFENANPSETEYIYSMLADHFQKNILDGAIFSTNVEPEWKNVAERLCEEMEEWWRENKIHPDVILAATGNSLKDTKVLTTRHFEAFVKYLFDYSKYSDYRLYCVRDSVLPILVTYHTKEYLTHLLIEAKGKAEVEMMSWNVKSGTAIDLMEIMKLDLSQVKIDLVDAWMSYISTIISPSRSDYDGYNAITLMTGTYTTAGLLNHLRLAMKDEALKGNAIVLLHEILDDFVDDETLSDR